MFSSATLKVFRYTTIDYPPAYLNMIFIGISCLTHCLPYLLSAFFFLGALQAYEYFGLLVFDDV
jgi:hypothetical protein